MNYNEIEDAAEKTGKILTSEKIVVKLDGHKLYNDQKLVVNVCRKKIEQKLEIDDAQHRNKDQLPPENKWKIMRERIRQSGNLEMIDIFSNPMLIAILDSN
ncbi:unnamed protein product [Caenorhabditis angaria]|uniref:Uncharacterized protein n=1 Tax=Caenorhabditis angaria TaxID=860376 RepID=A0A9P1IR01_9PELO|nr:unnamed protein product [Caenorhabditis angaria]